MEYEIDHEDVLIRMDGEWDQFAAANKAAHIDRSQLLGTSIWSHITGKEVKHLYQQLFRQVRRLQAPASIPFRCDSPGERRFLRLQVDPLPENHLHLTSFTEKVHPREVVPLLDPSRLRSSDILIICSWCKKVLLPNDRWVEVEEAINVLKLFESDLPKLSHGMCSSCFEGFRRELDESSLEG